MTAKSPHIRKPGKRRRLLFVWAGMLLAAAAALATGVIYLAGHPSAVKPLVEKALSMQTGATVRIDTLDMGFDPLRLDARGITVSPGASAAGFHLHAGALTAGATLSGPFGRRTLSIDSLRLEDYTVRFTSQLRLPSRPSGDRPSVTGRWIRRLARYFFFSDLTVGQLEATGGKLTVETTTRQATAEIANIRSGTDGGVRIRSNARLDDNRGRRLLELPEIQLDIAAPGLAASGKMTGRLQLRDGHFNSRTIGAFDLAAGANLFYDPERGQAGLENLLLEARVAAGPAAGDRVAGAISAAITADATFRFDTRQLSVTGWSLVGEELLTLTGSAGLLAVAPYPFKLQLDKGRFDSARLMNRLPLPERISKLPLSISGPVDLLGTVEGQLDESPEKWTGSLELNWARMPLIFQSGSWKLEGQTGGTVQIDGNLTDPQLQVALTVSDTMLAGSPLHLAPFEVSVDATGRFPTFQTDLDVRFPRLLLKTGNGKYGLRQVRLTAENGRLELPSGNALFPAVALSSDTLRNLTLTVDRSQQGLQVMLGGSDTGMAAAAAAWGLIPADWKIGGSDRIEATVIVDERRQVLFTTRAVFSETSAASPDEQTVVEGLQASADVNLRYRPEQRKWSSVAQFAIDRGEVLVGRYYYDFNSNPLTLSGRGTQVLPSQPIALDGVRLELADLLDLQAYGSVSTAAGPAVVSATVLIPDTELVPLYRRFIREPYKFERPSLENLSLGGRIGGELQLENTRGSWSTRGRISWSEGRISFRDESMSATGIALDLPVWDPAGPTDGPPVPGSLHIESLRLPSIPEQPLHLDFKVGPDTLTSNGPVEIGYGNGRLQVGAARLESIYSGRPELTTSLSVSQVTLDPLLEKIGGICDGGQLNGRLDRVVFSDNNLTSRGTLVSDMCGGRIEIRDPGVRRLLSPSPALRLDGVAEALDLERLTAGTSFGRIQGMLNGRVRNLEIVNAQPQAFDLLLETEQTEGVPQKINVRAVENIARLGGGANPFMGLAGTIVTLFKEFSYSKIGVRAQLQNDTFRINGTIKEGGKEYLVKKGGLSGVDVVNLNPDNRISFKDMVRRIQRIKQSKSGPVVK